jgi:hypothetical protein
MNQDFLSFVFITLGVLVSSFYQVALNYVFPPQSIRSNGKIWIVVKPYVLRFVSAMVISIVILAVAKSVNTDIGLWWQAFLVGFGVNKGIDIFNAFRRIKT